MCVSSDTFHLNAQMGLEKIIFLYGYLSTTGNETHTPARVRDASQHLFSSSLSSLMFTYVSVSSLQQRASGKVLFEMVCAHLNLVEGDYFSLEFQDQHKMTVRLMHEATRGNIVICICYT